jgi:DNA-binding NarL/FixJ family response regulator
MMGGTLVVSRDTNLHTHYKEQFEQLGFRDVTVTANEKDGLNMVINDLDPRLLVIWCNFYQCATPYMMSLLLRLFPDLNIAAVSISGYPADLAMGLVINGVKSYVNYVDGIEQFYKGLNLIKKGEKYVSPLVEERMETRSELPRPSQELTERQIEVMRLLCNGFTTFEIADVLHLSKRTVKFHKSELYNNLKIRNENELIRVALYLGFIKVDELDFYGGGYELSPKPDKRKTNKEQSISRRVYDFTN